MSNEEDYSDMPPLIYDDAPTNDETTTDEKPVVKPTLSVQTNSDEKDDVNDDVKCEDEKDGTNVDEEGEEEEETEDVEEDDKSDVENEDESDDVSDDDDMFVLTDDHAPVRCSMDYQALCRYRDHLVQKETRRFHDNGAIYVSHKNGETVLSYKDRNLIWNTERILKTFTIHRINKI